MTALDALARDMRACAQCEPLPLGARPIFQMGQRARILIAGQAPGRITHEKGVPFDDPSGNRLRQWLGVERHEFYDPDNFAILPMGFCYPGTAKNGDLPPRPECAASWRQRALNSLKDIKLTLVIGQYAMDWHMPDRPKETLTKTVHDWQNYWPALLPLPHPSPRNNIWLKRNPWFAKEVLPALQAQVRTLLDDGEKNRQL